MEAPLKRLKRDELDGKGTDDEIAVSDDFVDGDGETYTLRLHEDDGLPVAGHERLTEREGRTQIPQRHDPPSGVDGPIGSPSLDRLSACSHDAFDDGDGDADLLAGRANDEGR